MSVKSFLPVSRIRLLETATFLHTISLCYSLQSTLIIKCKITTRVGWADVRVEMAVAGGISLVVTSSTREISNHIPQCNSLVLIGFWIRVQVRDYTICRY